jgi:hypothetical protein
MLKTAKQQALAGGVRRCRTKCSHSFKTPKNLSIWQVFTLKFAKQASSI